MTPVISAPYSGAPISTFSENPMTILNPEEMKADYILERVSGLAGELQLANLQPQIAACRKLFGSDRQSIGVAVFGRFKAGKSSFLNHLIGRAVLPVGVVPLTAVITRLRYGPDEKAEVFFLNGAKREIQLDEIVLYVGENENLDNRKQVASVDLQLPALKPLEPLEFVDTPGLGSTLAHNTETTFQWLPYVGAAIIAVSCDAPLSDSDLALLDELHRHTPKIVLLLTKADLLTEQQRSEVLAFVQQQLQRKWEVEWPIFFYSDRPGFASLKSELEQHLLVPLIWNRGKASDEIGCHKLLSLTEQTLDYLRVALAAATQSESSRATLHEKLFEERRQFDLFREELQVLALQWSADALDHSLLRLEPCGNTLQQKVIGELQAQFLKWPSRLPLLLRLWREWLQAFLLRELTEVSSAERPMFLAPLQRANQHLTRTLQALQHRLADHVKDALGVILAPHEIIFDMPEPAAPPVDVGYMDAAFSLISPLIPLKVFRPLIERSLLRKSRWEMRKNLSRLASKWRDHVAKVINELIRQAEQQARDELTALERTLGQTVPKTPELKEIIDEMDQLRNRLQGKGLDMCLGDLHKSSTTDGSHRSSSIVSSDYPDLPAGSQGFVRGGR